MKGDLVSTKRYWTLPKSCGSQSLEWEERKKIRAKRGSLCELCKSRKTVTCHGLRVVEPVCHQAPLRGRFADGAVPSRGGEWPRPPEGAAQGCPWTSLLQVASWGARKTHATNSPSLGSLSVICRFSLSELLRLGYTGTVSRCTLVRFRAQFSPVLPQRTNAMLIVVSVYTFALDRCSFSVSRGSFRVPLRGFPCLLCASSFVQYCRRLLRRIRVPSFCH